MSINTSLHSTTVEDNGQRAACVLDMNSMRTAIEKLHLSEISPHVIQSEIRAMTQECDRMGGVNLAQGVCDTEVPRWWPRARFARFVMG